MMTVSYRPLTHYGSLSKRREAMGVAALPPIVLTKRQCLTMLLDAHYAEIEPLLVSESPETSPNGAVPYDRDRALDILLEYASSQPTMGALHEQRVGTLRALFGRVLASNNLPNKRGALPSGGVAPRGQAAE